MLATGELGQARVPLSTLHLRGLLQQKLLGELLLRAIGSLLGLLPTDLDRHEGPGHLTPGCVEL